MNKNAPWYNVYKTYTKFLTFTMVQFLTFIYDRSYIILCQWNPTKFLTFNRMFYHNKATNFYNTILGDNFIPPHATLKYKGTI